MATTVYRSVHLILQNSTNEAMTVEGTAVLCGDWKRGSALADGQVIERQSARALATESASLERGTQGYMRLGSRAGYVTVTWHLPWIGEFALEVTFDGGDRVAEVVINDDEPAAVAALVAITPRKVA